MLKKILDTIIKFRKKPLPKEASIKSDKPKVKAKSPKLDIDLLIKKETEEIDKYSDFLKELGDNFEQKRAVVSDHKRILVLAGAGSGKTKVLTKRFIHLVKNKGIDEHNILALTFTNEARNEMEKRITSTLNIKPESLKYNVKTIHSFCSYILRQNEQFKIVDDTEQRRIVDKIVYYFKDNSEIMQSLYDYIKDNLLEWVREKDNKTGREPQVKGKPQDFGQRRIKTFAGVPVRSKSERDIANFLTSLGIEWEYEKPAEWADRQFLPDFTINDDIYIEHWCYKEDTPEFLEINKKNYLQNRHLKEEQYKKHKKILISIEEKEMLDLLKLQTRLKTELEELTAKKFRENEILELLQLSDQYKRAYEKFIDELIEVINLAKSRLLEVEDVKELVKGQEKEKVVNFYNVLIPVMDKYERFLRRKDFGLKDFNDLIKHAVQLLRNNQPRQKSYQDKYAYILVDEYQDVGFGEVELLKLLIREDTNLFVVGDDWQSIYGWRGSDVNYILNFDKDFASVEKIILPINYRSTRNIVGASTYFIQLSKKQHKKDIRCCNEMEAITTKIIQLNAEDDFQAAKYIIQKIHKLKDENNSLKDSDFLILTRSSRICSGYRKIFMEYGFQIKIQTIHWSKGREFNYVFVLGLKNGFYGFPNVYADKDIKKVIWEIPIEDREEEERRLFYVAMTRAKKKLFLIAEEGNESEFAKQVPEEYKFIYSNKEKNKK